MSESVNAPVPVVVVGGAGKTGYRVLLRLHQLGRSTRAVSRRSDPVFDWDDETTWPAALQGADCAYVAYAPDLAVPEAADRIQRLARVAKGLGLARFVLLSGRGEEGARKAETMLFDVLPDSTVLRCAWFFQNFSESVFRDDVLGGEIALPVGEIAEPFIDAEDIADIAVEAILHRGYAGRICELTGPEALTFAEVTRQISVAAGREVRFRTVDLGDYCAGLADAGVPEDGQWLMRHLFTEVLDGRNSKPSRDVETILRRGARSFDIFAAEAARAGVWDGDPCVPSP